MMFILCWLEYLVIRVYSVVSDVRDGHATCVHVSILCKVSINTLIFKAGKEKGRRLKRNISNDISIISF